MDNPIAEVSYYKEDGSLNVFLNNWQLGYFHFDNQDRIFKQLEQLIVEAYKRGYKQGVLSIQSDLRSVLGLKE